MYRGEICQLQARRYCVRSVGSEALRAFTPPPVLMLRPASSDRGAFAGCIGQVMTNAFVDRALHNTPPDLIYKCPFAPQDGYVRAVTCLKMQTTGDQALLLQSIVQALLLECSLIWFQPTSSPRRDGLYGTQQHMHELLQL